MLPRAALDRSEVARRAQHDEWPRVSHSEKAGRFGRTVASNPERTPKGGHRVLGRCDPQQPCASESCPRLATACTLAGFADEKPNPREQ